MWRGCGGRWPPCPCRPGLMERIRLAVDVSHWLRPEAATSPERLFCHVYGRGKGNAQMIPGWPYSVVAALEPGRTSWTAVLDAQRLGPADDLTEVTATQVHEVVARLIAAGQWREGDPAIVIVFDAGYDIMRLAFLLAGLPVHLLGRIRSDRVLRFPPPPGLARWQARPPAPAWQRVPARRPEHVACGGGNHDHRHGPLWHCPRQRLAAAASPAGTPGRLETSPRRPACPRRDVNPAGRGPPARRP